MLKVIVVNEKKGRDDKTGKRSVTMDLAPRLSDLVDNAAHVLARVEMRPGASESVIRVKRVDTDQALVQAKCRTANLKDGDKLTDLWAKLNAGKGLTTNGKPSTDATAGEIEGDKTVVIPTNLTEAVRFLNHKIGQTYYRTTDHLANTLRKHHDGTPVDGDTKGWEQAVGFALTYAADQQNTPAGAGAGK